MTFKTCKQRKVNHKIIIWLGLCAIACVTLILSPYIVVSIELLSFSLHLGDLGSFRINAPITYLDKWMPMHLYGADPMLQALNFKNPDAFMLRVIQLFVLAAQLAAFSYANYWLFRQGLPFWVSFIGAVVSAWFLIIMNSAALLISDSLVVPCVIILAIRLVDVLWDNGSRLKSKSNLFTLFAPIFALIVFEPTFLLVATAITIILWWMFKNSRRHVLLAYLIVLVACAVVLFALVPNYGWQAISQSLDRQLFSNGFDLQSAHGLALPSMAIVWFLILFVLAWLAWTFASPLKRNIIWLQLWLMLHMSIMGFYLGAMQNYLVIVWAFALFAVILVALSVLFMYPYSVDKATLRRRLLDARAAIDPNTRHTYSLKACDLLLENITKIDPNAGYIALYNAFGSELTLEPLKAKLGALGYKLVYPSRVSDNQIEFYTTIGVNDDELMSILLDNNPFEPASIDQSQNDMQMVDPNNLSLIILPCVGLDMNNYRLGFGKGCYDRYLTRVPRKTPTIIVGFSEQLVDFVPRDKFDRRAHSRIVV